jgi:DNA (cytosine-5)-methyltransferase 1
MTHGSLFSGIGGFDLAAEWMGWENVFHCEWNEFGQKILKHYWPKAISYADITKTDFTIHRGQIDILTGGFPCQPYSLAGKRKGKEDERHLWPEMLRTIREIQPVWIVGENVPGLINWGGGLVFNEVCTDLENEGYKVQPVLLPACAVNAPHRRDRIWFVAYSSEIDGQQAATNREWQSSKQVEEGGKIWSELTSISSNGHATNTNTNEKRIQRRKASRYSSDEREIGEQLFRGYNQFNNWSEFPTVSPVRDGNDGISSRLDTTTISKTEWNKSSLEAGGNAIVPQVAFQIFKAIDQTNKFYQIV